MKCDRLRYYLMNDRGIIAKGISFENWIFDFESRKWVEDTKSIINDALMGYDPSEPEGSPYGIGSTSVMDEIKHISYEIAMQIIGDTIVQDLMEKWHFKYEKAKAEWDENPKMDAKLVETYFCLYGTRYTISPKDFGWEKGPSDEGFMESIQKELEEDLIEVGATEIEHSGFLD